jgi:ATP-dependent exoDNAse (exonuclease V) beta subunit
MGKINFNEEEHKYTNDNGQVYTSVTRLISKYKQPFDSEYWSTYKAIKDVLIKEGAWDDFKQEAGGWENIVNYYLHTDKLSGCIDAIESAKQSYLDKWEREKNEACEKGTSFHKAMEQDTINASVVIHNNKKMKVQDQMLIDLQDFNGNGLFTELLVHNDAYMIAGQIDLCFLLDNKKVSIKDYKTNKKIEKRGFRGAKMKYPLHGYDDCNFVHYTLQMSTYAWMLEQLGYEIESLELIHVDRETGGHIKDYPVKYEKQAVEWMLQHHRKDVF